LASDDFPEPTMPARIRFGAVMMPRWYSTHGSYTNDDPL
jgi:hypothetical protein